MDTVAPKISGMIPPFNMFWGSAQPTQTALVSLARTADSKRWSAASFAIAAGLLKESRQEKSHGTLSISSD